MLKLLRAKDPAGRREVAALCESRRVPDFGALTDALPIVSDVLTNGAPALARHVARLDGETISVAGLLIDPRRGKAPRVPAAFAEAFRLAAKRIAAYHELQRPEGFSRRTAGGLRFVEKPVPHERVGVYVPGGRAFYPSSLLMGAVPARVAGVREIVVATPPRAFRESAELRWALRELGVDKVLLAGGAHGIAGLVSVARCTKIVGPGNRWVAAAKQLVSSIVSIDLPAGPSEVLILASEDAPAGWVAADLLAQAEHDPNALCLLFTDSAPLAERVSAEVSRQLEDLPTAAVARRSLAANGKAVVFGTLNAAVQAARDVAAEHVQLMGREAERAGRTLMETAGVLFSGRFAPTALGDYMAGPNHVLPTGGAARSFSGLSLRDFYRTSHGVSATGGPLAPLLCGQAAVLASFEGLAAHERALRLRAESGRRAAPPRRAARPAARRAS